MVKRRQKLNPTAFKFHQGLLRFKRRVDFPCWHIDHVRKLISLLRETADALDEITQMNAARDADKVFYAQNAIMRLNWDAGRLTPQDPRERGGAQYTYDHRGGQVLRDVNGFKHVEAREDLDELEPGPNMRAAHQAELGIEPGKQNSGAIAKALSERQKSRAYKLR